MSKTLVFVGTYNGEQFIETQLRSILGQTVPAEIVVSDDGSTDQTVSLVRQLQSKDNPICITSGPSQGYALNFLSAFSREDLGRFEFLAWSDQDDVWHSDHLEVAQNQLKQFSGPAVACCRTRWIDEDGAFIRLSPRRGKQIHFENALSQSIAGGNTFVFNRAAIAWLSEVLSSVSLPQGLSHDWLIYQLFCGAGFDVIFSPNPTIDYRQHSTNFLGENRSLRARLRRVSMIFRGSFRDQVDAHFNALNALNRHLLPRHCETLQALSEARRQPMLFRLARMRWVALRRERLIETLLLKSLFLFGFY
jgi:glycosyltransferase involved in cell wall biosynthesis